MDAEYDALMQVLCMCIFPLVGSAIIGSVVWGMLGRSTGSQRPHYYDPEEERRRDMEAFGLSLPLDTDLDGDFDGDFDGFF